MDQAAPSPRTGVEAMLAASGLPDDLQVQVRPGLAATLAALAAEPDLSDQGRLRAQAQFEDQLRRLAAIAADRARFPQIAAVVIDRPVFILGLPRCGTSLLHALIAADPTVRTPLSWEVAAPSPPPEAATFDTDPRAAAFDAYVDAAFAGEWADVHKAHPIGARIPQECGMILETAFQSLNPVMLFRLADYYQWYLGADTEFAYRVHKMWLQHLAWRNPRPRWVLKVQEHSFHLPALRSVYPDALFVQPHRDPVTVLASICRLIEVIRGIAFARQDRAALGEELLHLWHDGQMRMMAYRNAHPEVAILDMRYADIARAPVEAVRSVYDFAGIRFSQGTEARIRAWLADNPADKHGRHSYTLEDYGLTAARVRAVYADYIDAFGAYF
jgi:hypothetical protein